MVGELKYGMIVLIEEGIFVIGIVIDVKVVVYIRGNLKEVESCRVRNIVIVLEFLVKL